MPAAARKHKGGKAADERAVELKQLDRAGRGAVLRDPWIDRIAWLMDNSIPIGRWSIGLDGLIGLVPGLGDIAGSLVSLVIIARAAAAGVPRVAIARMAANVALETIIGALPLVGDLFDIAFKANVRNARIYYDSLSGADGALRHWGFFAAIAAVLLAILAIPIITFVLLMRAVAG